VYIEVPNHDDSLLSIFDVPGYREFYYREPHIFYYNKSTLMTLLNRAGFEGEIASSGFDPNALNQLHWIMTGQPQHSATIAYGAPRLPFLATQGGGVQSEFMALLENFEKQYRALLERHLLCSHIIFIGKARF
jgi:hypothetical protein